MENKKSTAIKILTILAIAFVLFSGRGTVWEIPPLPEAILYLEV